MFFMVSVISASAFTGIGSMLTLGDPRLSSMTNPYAFTYTNSGFTDSAVVDRQIRKIEETLVNREVPYVKGSYQPLYENNNNYIVKLSEYNRLAKALGYEERVLDRNDLAFNTAPNITARNKLLDTKEDSYPYSADLYVGEQQHIQVQMLPPATDIVFPMDGEAGVYIVSDDLYSKIRKAYIKEIQMNVDFYSDQTTFFVVKDWMSTRSFAPELLDTIEKDRPEKGYVQFNSLVVDWLNNKQTNGIILIVSGLIGIVFFTFAASFTYFRLYADLERDEAQYRMIGKMGLSRLELRKIVTRQLVLMFFLPLLVALIHSSVAFAALYQLVQFSVLEHSLQIFMVFVSMQIVFFALVRWRYLRHMYSKLV